MVVYRRITPDLEIPKVNITTTTNDTPNHEAEKKVTPANNSAPGPHAILICRPNSHPFHERHLYLDQPVKVGRSVARCRPGSVNAIFDCKVLSRNHALLWYENGKFFLQDTKSSNGTFINNQRLSKGSEESTAREVCSGDIVQFGVDVVENTLTHGCIIATLKLFLPDGKEAKASPTVAVTNAYSSTISSQDLYQLSQCLQEALHREQQLETKLAKLHKMVNNTFEASNTNWKALIDEDRLISRIENLESQLITVSKNVSDDKLREEVNKLLEDKDRYQNTAKESLIKIFQEKLEVLRKLQDIESDVGNGQEECQHLRESYEKSQKEIQLLAEKADEYLKEINILTEKLREAEEKEEKANKVMEEKILLEEQVLDLKENMAALLAKIEALQADKDIASKQLSCLKAHYEQTQKEKIAKGDESMDIFESTKDEKSILEDLLLISDDSSDSLLTKMYNENGKDEGQELKKNNSRGELEDLDKHNIFTELKAEIERHKELLDETRKKKCSLECEVTRLKDELAEIQNSFKNSEKKAEMLENELTEQKNQIATKDKEIVLLQEKLNSLEIRSKAISQSINDPETSEYLSKACDTLKAKVGTLNIDKQGTSSKENMAKEEKSPSLDLTSTLGSNSDEFIKLELNKTKAKLESIEKELEVTREELFTVKESYEECNEKKANLQKELKAVSEEMQLIAYQTKTVSACSVIPLILLCLAILLAVCPYLSYFTATSDASESNT